MSLPPSGGKPATSSRVLAVRGWSSRLAAVTVVFLLFEGLSGLWTYLGPFSVASQLLVLVHSAAGVAFFGAVLYYSFRHLAVWARQKVTAAMFLGYALLLATAVALVTGLVVTWQALFGLRVAPSWELVHLVSGLAVLGLLVAHLVLAFLRRLMAARRDRELASAMGGFGRRGGVLLGGTLAVLVAVGVAWPRPDFRHPPPDDYTLPAYAQEFEEYRGNPFAPTYARTADLHLVEPELLAHSESCGTAGCHGEILDEWEPSAHRFAAMNPPFQEVQRRFAAEREPAETRYCAGCHDPISLFAGAKDIHNQSLSSPGVDEGISCVACHSISQVDQRGNADYVLTPPRKYLGENGDGAAKVLSDFLIRAYPRQHLADYDRNLLRTPEFCGACHKQFIPEALNRFGLVSGQNQYDEWKNGHWHTDDATTDLACRDCHMRLVYDSRDPGRGEAGDRRRSGDDDAHRHHGFIATNNFMPAVLELPHWREQVELTNEWVRGETVLPEIAEVFPSGPVASLDLLVPATARPGEEVAVRAVVTNRKAGHNFITGPLDFIRSWIHLRAVDAGGRLIAEWGAVDPESRRILDAEGREHRIGNRRDEGAFVLEALPIDERGEILKKHELWKKAGGHGKRVIFPTYSDSHVFRLRIPDDARGPVRLEADLNYRRYRQEFLDLVVPDLERESGVRQPTVTQASASASIAVGEETADARAGVAGG